MLYSLQQIEGINSEHMSTERYSFQRTSQKALKQTLLKRNRSLPSLSFRCPELLSRVLEKNLNIATAVAFEEKWNAATLQGRTTD